MRAEKVLHILFVTVREVFSNVLPGKEVTNMTTIYRLVTKFRVDACLREVGGHFQHLQYNRYVFFLTDKKLVSLVILTSPKLTEMLLGLGFKWDTLWHGGF
jgi:hypothetical protein